jgi:glucokinase
METHTLVADVGGTQSRLGLAQKGILNQASVQYFVNARFQSFYEVIAQFLKETSNIQISRCVIAIAGPITANTGKLTNLDWEISIDDLRQSTDSTDATLINDLTALGYCLQALPSGGTQHIGGPNSLRKDSGQYLVVGLGTGFNVCPVINAKAGHPICLQAELGHAALPHNIKSTLSRMCDASAFTTVEDIFSGKGLSKLYQVISGSNAKDGALIVKDHLNRSDPSATKTLVSFSELLGLMTREMMNQYLPISGIYFAGSVSRGIFGSDVTGVFNETVFAQDHFLAGLSKIPIRLITDDAAGLLGCSQRSLWI